ncbi:MAG: NUDIX domain-containing protein, partial [Balneolaceae bacterium]
MYKKKLIDVYPYKIIDGKPQFLLLKRSRDKIYEGQWRMIGGKVEQNETYWQAALRELAEETKLKSNRFWSVPTVNHFYESSSDQIHLIPAFGA